MNVTRKCLLLAVLVLPAACAGTSETRVSAESHYDTDYISAVEYVAYKRGVRVFWVNPPNERIED
ncbi:hypothetical protein [Arenimonas caeni]|jgi:hypothetical protein|nr:hypothetical protein [Arenimonas caeni]MDY0021252.1 hypothetical protein [Arenimonas caeni]